MKIKPFIKHYEGITDLLLFMLFTISKDNTLFKLLILLSHYLFNNNGSNIRRILGELTGRLKSKTQSKMLY